jgi:drug/metabolite transporter superfamily protein YnfA
MGGWVWAIFAASAVLEVGGDALIRAGLRGGRLALVVAGFLVLGSYGVLLNTMTWDFTRLLGTYVAVFALTSALFGCFVFREFPSPTTWFGLVLVLAGAAVMQLGK